MGYAINGKCYGTEADALNAFKTMFPTTAGNYLTNLTSASITSGAITYTTSSKTLIATTNPVSATSVMILPTCAESMDQFSTSSILFIVALFFAGVLGFRTGFRT